MIESAALSDIGKVRKANEDFFSENQEMGLWIVADGVGGNGHGDVASQVVVQTVERRVRQGRSVQEAIMDAHDTLHKVAEADPDYSGMATTVVVCRLQDNIYEISWVGDSRAYLWNGSVLYRLTKDHNYAQQMVEDNELQPEEAFRHPMRHLLMHAVGSGEPELLRIDTISGSLEANDTLLLCTDGLCGEVSDGEMKAVLQDADKSIKEKCSILLNKALDAGGGDNITLTLLKFLVNRS
ncbi:PP2C family protein-serine/threonine phosphatase [Oleiphilus messinensis]|nr:protein phosphatase 2C domain-containing protein [Oleiphilus messinensis]